ncbi:hypothetical protein CVT25_002539 [Psilocybe cyanescens]|uniref:Deacetylase sirtuin-type domain-containing protein n=1 Tax=Psilocybe cyanescens TaxID=93625 RepID=A0A409XUP3_PSICY|nr:hypothetical protein CVT25_002539 [Psilocybe cyanescens]
MNASHVSVTLDSESVVHQSDHRDPLAASNQSIATFHNEILSRQVQAFLEASEDVDVDAETIEDILSVLINIDENDENCEPSSDLHIDEDEESHDEDSQEISTLFPGMPENAENRAKDTWSKEEIKKMTHLLKERGSSAFIEEYVRARNIPITKLLEAFNVELCPELQTRRPQTLLYFLRVALSHQLRNRDKLPQYNTISDAVNLIRNSQRILILTGAGISVSCGIPDFRSRDGLYASLKGKGEYELDDPQQMFDIQYFKENPSGIFAFFIPLQGKFHLSVKDTGVTGKNSQIYPSNFVPSPCHRFIKQVEDRGKLLRNYTQNIDTLETLAGVKKVLQCHGSFATASCLQCRQRVPGIEIEADILSHKVPLCKICNAVPSVSIRRKGKISKKKAKGQWDSDVEDESDEPAYPPGIMKPDITFFGEKLTDAFDHSLAEDRSKVDLLLVIGTSLKVSPVAEILSHLPHSIPQILINKTPIRHINPDIMLLGNADNIVLYLCKELGWELPVLPEVVPTPNSNVPTTRLQPPRGNLKKRVSTDDSDLEASRNPERVGESHVWLFDGADGGKWLQQLKSKLGIPKSAPASATNSGYNTRQSTPGTSPQKVEADGRRTKKARAT